MINILKYSYIIKIFYLIITTSIFLNLIVFYVGNIYFYILFSISISLLFLTSFNKKEFKFFQFFLSIFLWFGFYFKLYVCIVVIKNFPEGVGNFDFLSSSYNEVIIVSSLAFLGLFFGFNISFKKKIYEADLKYLEKTYYKFDKQILYTLIFFLITISILNLKYSFFQKGFVSNDFLSGSLRNITGYLFMIGFGIAISIIINFELNKGKNKFIYLALFETFCTSISTLSRAMIFDLFAYVIGYISRLKFYKFNSKYFVNIIFFLIISTSLIVTTVIYTSEIRNSKNIHLKSNKIPKQNFSSVQETKENRDYSYKFIKNQVSKKLDKYYINLQTILTHRFVGIEGVMAVQGYENKNFRLFLNAFDEEYMENKLSFYDRNFLKDTSSYSKSLKRISNQHAITLPGFIGFFYYTGSKFFVFIISFLIALIFNLITLSIQNIFRNPILTAFVSNLIAYRLIHWGFAPLNSYKLFLSLFLSLVMIIVINNLLKKYHIK